MVIIILTNQLTLTLAILILILQSNVLTNPYFPPYPNYSFKSFDPPWRSRRSFITLTRPMRSFGEGREGAGKGGKFGDRLWGSREAMARRCGLGGTEVAAVQRGVKQREETDWAAGLYLSQPHPDGWRVTAAP